MIPMLTLGVPGDAVAAIMIGALTIQGLTPGPMLFKTNKVLVYTIFLGMFVANTIMVLLGFSCIRLFTKVLSVPNVQLRTSEHRSMYSYVRLSIDRCTATYV